jgi:hypothetical protein
MIRVTNLPNLQQDFNVDGNSQNIKIFRSFHQKKNKIPEDINIRNPANNQCYYGLQHMSSQELYAEQEKLKYST